MKAKLTLLALVASMLILSLGCAAKTEPVSLPTFEPLPAVHFSPGPDGGACLDQMNMKALQQREQLHKLREDALEELCKALGATPPKPTADTTK